jgi:general secretion pathway protein I
MRVSSAKRAQPLPHGRGSECVTEPRASASGTRGFTLMEVLVATLIMAIAVAGALSGISAAARNASKLTQYDRATILARQKMDELLVNTNRAGGDGVFDPEQSGGSTVGWHATSSAFEGGPGPGVVERIELEIWWMDGATKHVFALEGYRRRGLYPGELPPKVTP